VTRPPAALFVAGLVVWCAGCPRKAADPAAALARVEYARRTFRSSLAGCTDAVSGAPTACVRLEVDYVDLTRAPGSLVDAVGVFVASTVLRPAADAEPVSSVEDLRDVLYERYRAQQRETPGYQNQWLVQRSIKVVCSTERVLALAAVLRASTGEGDASERVEHRTFHTRTGAPVGLDDVVLVERQSDFEEVVRARLDGGRAASGSMFERTPGSAGGTGWLDPQAVLVCPDVVTVQWHEDDTVTTVELPRGEVKAFLRSDAP